MGPNFKNYFMTELFSPAELWCNERDITYKQHGDSIKIRCPKCGSEGTLLVNKNYGWHFCFPPIAISCWYAGESLKDLEAAFVVKE